jgi:hypothetical protein
MTTWGLVDGTPAKVVVIVTHVDFGSDASGVQYQGITIRKFTFVA